MCIDIQLLNYSVLSSLCGKTLTSVLFVVPGIPFTRVFALDQDDPQTPNAHLSYSLASQIPNNHHVFLFQIDPDTGEISTTEEGNNVKPDVGAQN